MPCCTRTNVLRGPERSGVGQNAIFSQAAQGQAQANMFLRLRLLMGSLAGGGLLLVILCLGAQNLDQRPQLNLGFGKTAPLPSGFVVGVALALGVMTGGIGVALLMPTPRLPDAAEE